MVLNMSADGFSFDLDETALQELYTWIDEIPLSRPKKNISRDFSDGGMCCVQEVNSFLYSFDVTYTGIIGKE